MLSEDLFSYTVRLSVGQCWLELDLVKEERMANTLLRFTQMCACVHMYMCVGNPPGHSHFVMC